jgi:uncharacterized membrane protein
MRELVVLGFDGVGTSEDFIRGRGQTIPNGSSALFGFIRHSTPDKVLPEMASFKARALKTSLSKQQEERLRSAPTSAPVAA